MIPSRIHKGTLLIASPQIQEGLYVKSVVLVCEHNAGGSFGLIVNKPLAVQLPEDILEPSEIMNPNIAMRTGGPIQMSQMMLLHSSSAISDQVLAICPGLFLGGNLEFLQQSAKDEHGPNIRICFGYSGWASRQLDKELSEEHWFLHQAKSRHIFNTPPENLWSALLQEMGGKYAPLALIPDDLSLN